MEKEIIRERILKKRRLLNKKQIQKKSDKIKKRLLALDKFNKSRVINCYLSNDNEADTLNLIRKFEKIKTFTIPYIIDGKLEASKFQSVELKKGEFGILEPSNPNKFPKEKIDVFIIPGIAFDKKGNRIGYGRGHYDRFIKESQATTVGLAYDFQIVDAIPAERHDIKLNYIVTETKIIKCENG